MQEEQDALKARRADDKTVRGGAEGNLSYPIHTSDKQPENTSQPTDVEQAAPDHPLPQQNSAATPARDAQPHHPAPVEEDDKVPRLVHCSHLLQICRSNALMGSMLSKCWFPYM